MFKYAFNVRLGDGIYSKKKWPSLWDEKEKRISKLWQDLHMYFWKVPQQDLETLWNLF